MSPHATPIAHAMLTLAAPGCASIPRSVATDARIAPLDWERLADERLAPIERQRSARARAPEKFPTAPAASVAAP